MWSGDPQALSRAGGRRCAGHGFGVGYFANIGLDLQQGLRSNCGILAGGAFEVEREDCLAAGIAGGDLAGGRDLQRAGGDIGSGEWTCTRGSRRQDGRRVRVGEVHEKEADNL